MSKPPDVIYPVDFFNSLDLGTQLLVLESALQALEDEADSNFSRVGHRLEDVSEEEVLRVLNILCTFMYDVEE